MQDPSKFTGSEVRYRDPESDQVHFAIAFKGASWTDPDMLTLMVMQTMLGKHSSRVYFLTCFHCLADSFSFLFCINALLSRN